MSTHTTPETGAGAATPPPFTFDGNYHNDEQVRPYMAGFRAVLAELEAAGRYPYNDSFRGRVPGLAEASASDQDTGIYLCQNLNRLDALAVTEAAFLAEGGRVVETMEPGQVLRGTVVHAGFYMGGTGWTVYEQARLVERDGRPYAVLPKGKRTQGHYLAGSGRVLIAEGK